MRDEALNKLADLAWFLKANPRVPAPSFSEPIRIRCCDETDVVGALTAIGGRFIERAMQNGFVALETARWSPLRVQLVAAIELISVVRSNERAKNHLVPR